MDQSPRGMHEYGRGDVYTIAQLADGVSVSSQYLSLQSRNLVQIDSVGSRFLVVFFYICDISKAQNAYGSRSL